MDRADQIIKQVCNGPPGESYCSICWWSEFGLDDIWWEWNGIVQYVTVYSLHSNAQAPCRLWLHEVTCVSWSVGKIIWRWIGVYEAMLWNTGSPQTSLRSTLAKNNWDLDELSWHVHRSLPSPLEEPCDRAGSEESAPRKSGQRNRRVGFLAQWKESAGPGGVFLSCPEKFGENERFQFKFACDAFSGLKNIFSLQCIRCEANQQWKKKKKNRGEDLLLSFKSLLWKQHLVLDYALLLLRLNLR